MITRSRFDSIYTCNIPWFEREQVNPSPSTEKSEKIICSFVNFVWRIDTRILDILKESGNMQPAKKSWSLFSLPKLILYRLLPSIKSRNKPTSDLGLHQNGETANGSQVVGLERKKNKRNKCLSLPTLNLRNSLGFHGFDGHALPSKVASQRVDSIFEGTSSSGRNDSSELCSKDAPTSSTSGLSKESLSLHFGVGVSLVLIFANNKMAELKEQMESLLTDIKNEIVWKREATSETTSSYMNPSYNDCSFIKSASGLPKFHPISSNENGIGQLEAELEAELEILQLNIEEKNRVLPRQEFIEVDTMSTYPLGTHGLSGRDELTTRVTLCNGDFYGVSPYELERKLHQVAETRQQERIAELETALEQAEKLLQEKEMEICWWKEHAKTLGPKPVVGLL